MRRVSQAQNRATAAPSTLAPNADARRNYPMRAALVIVAIAIAVLTYLIISRRQPPSRVTRSEAVAIAESYIAHEWTPTEANVFHGVDPAGIRVDTPDALFQADGGERGWWIVGQPNSALPYKWGGFDTPEEFDRGLREGKCAGDIYSAEKRRLLDDAVSARAVGIDCSGFVSRCWRLPRSYSTRELPRLCDAVTDLTQIKPGDIFNTHNSHVRLFSGWADAAHTRVRVYEASAKVQVTEHVLQQMIEQSYTAWRYRGMRD